MAKRIKHFDAIAFKRAAQERIRRATEGMTREQEIEYFRRAAEEGPLGEWWKQVKAATAARKSQSSDRE